MIQLETTAFDICKISKIISKYRIKATIKHCFIILEGDDIPEKLLEKLYSEIRIINIKNFKEFSGINQNKRKTNPEEYELIYKKVLRGEVYLCDFADPYGTEIGYERYALILQNDLFNSYSTTVTVIPFTTTKDKKNFLTHKTITFSNSNMINYYNSHVSEKENTLLVEQIRTVDKRRLREYLGKMNDEFMLQINNLLNIFLSNKKVMFSNNLNVLPKNTYNFNDLQLNVLKTVNINKITKICNMNIDLKGKIKKILLLFGFKIKKYNDNFLIKAILLSVNHNISSINTICKVLSENDCNLTQSEIKHIIDVDIICNFKKDNIKTIDFILLVVELVKMEEK